MKPVAEYLTHKMHSLGQTVMPSATSTHHLLWSKAVQLKTPEELMGKHCLVTGLQSTVNEFRLTGKEKHGRATHPKNGDYAAAK